MKNKLLNLNKSEVALFRRLKNYQKIQDYLDTLKINFEEGGDTCSSPRTVIERGSAHCIEAAMLAAAILRFHKKEAYLLDLKANTKDFDHVVCLFKQNRKWGAISKSNHPALRYRDPVYLNVRELAMSYFHEYINKEGEKTLRSYSIPYSLKRYGEAWITSEDNVWEIANELDDVWHFSIMAKGFKPRKVGKFEMEASNLEEWKPKKANKPKS